MLTRYVVRSEADFGAALARRARIGSDAKVAAAARAVIDDVRARGDDAITDAVRKFDGVPFGPERFRVSDDEWKALADRCDPAVVKALSLAATRVAEFHRQQLPHAVRWDHEGATLTHRPVPLASVLCYAPGGRAVYPSSVLMGAVPAKVAGVKRIVVTSPAKGTDDLSPAIAAAARIAGATELWRIGGVQAIAGFSLGTASIARVDKVVGPGNAYVTEAKRLLSGEVGIDGLAGPTEVLILAEPGPAKASWVAADLVAQAEHDPEARAVLVTTSAAFADAVERALHEEPMNEVVRAALSDHGDVIVVPDLATGAAFAEAYAPEHLELLVNDVEPLLPVLTTAGCVFVGPYAPVPVGDYIAGANHTLPTAGTGRFASGLSVHDFLRRQTLVHYTEARLREDVAPLRALAYAEGLPAHAHAAEARFK